jgi:hypothetical protein
MASNLPFGSGVVGHRAFTSSPDPRQHPFRSGHRPLSGQLYEDHRRRCRHVVPGFLLPFGHRHSLLGSSCTRWRVGPSLRSAYRTTTSWPGLHRGCHVPHERDAAGEGALCTPRTAVHSRPVKSLRSAPAAFQRPVPISRWNNPSARVLMTRHHQGFICIHPSGISQPVTPGWNGNPWAMPQASHPAITRDAR